VAARATEATLELAAREEVAHEVARAVARAEELAEEATTIVAAHEEMARDRRRWDEDMAAARCLREVHELTTQRRHRRNLARRQAHRARQAGDEGPTPSIWAGATTCCRRQQDEDGDAATTSRG
jgi:DNA-directed RNA polymerase subunit K/omega